MLSRIKQNMLENETLTRSDIKDLDLNRYPEGYIITVDGLSYKRQVGATAIPDIPGWVPVAPINAAHFNFLGNGTINDTNKISISALNYLNILGGGTLHFNAGLFLLADTNTNPTRSGGEWDNHCSIWVKYNNIRLKGVGRDETILKLANGQNAHVLKFGQRAGGTIAVNGCGFSDLTIDGNRDNQTPADQATYFNNYGVDISNGTSDFIAERIRVRNCQWYAIGVQRDNFRNVIIRDFILERTGSDGIDAKGDSSINYGNLLENGFVKEWGLAEPATLSAAVDARSGWLINNVVVEIDSGDTVSYARDAFRVQDSDSDPDPTPKQGTIIRDCKAYSGKSSTTSISGNAAIRFKSRWCRVEGGEFVGWNHGINIANPDGRISNPIIRDCYKGVYAWQDSFTSVGAEADQLRVNAVIRNCVFGVHLDSVDNVSVDSTIAANGTNLWIGSGCTNTRVRGEIFGGTTANLINDGTGTSLINVAGITTKSKRLVQIPVDTTGLKSGSVAHQLSVTPAINDVTLTLERTSNVGDFIIGFAQITSVDATNVNYTVRVTTASPTAGANVGLQVVTRALEF